MDEKDQKKIDKAKKDYETAKAKGDKAGMDKAHSSAEKVRGKYGFSGGSDGSQKIKVESSGSSKSKSSSSKSSKMSGDDEDKIAQAKKAWETANAAGDKDAMDKAHALAESVRGKYGFSGGSDGSRTVSLPDNNASIFQGSTVARKSNDYADFNRSYQQEIYDTAKKHNVDIGVAADMVASDARYGTGNNGYQYGDFAVTDAMRKAEQLAYENNIKHMDKRNFDAVGDAYSGSYEHYKGQGDMGAANAAHDGMESIRSIRDPQYQGSVDGSGFNPNAQGGDAPGGYFGDYSQYFQPQQELQPPKLVKPDTDFDRVSRDDYYSNSPAPARVEREQAYVNPLIADREERIKKLLEFRRGGGM